MYCPVMEGLVPATHAFLSTERVKAWVRGTIPGSSPGTRMTAGEVRGTSPRMTVWNLPSPLPLPVMAGLDPATHVFLAARG